MMTLTLMMFPSEMMSASPNVFGKHCIIANKMSNIIFAEQMHHIACGDASLKNKDRIFLNISLIYKIRKAYVQNVKENYPIYLSISYYLAFVRGGQKA